MFTFETERLGFRHIEDSDAEALLEMFSDPEVMRFMDGVWGASEISAWLEKPRIRGDSKWLGFRAAIRRDTGEYIGNIGLLEQEVDEEQVLEVGYWLLRRHWGHGFAVEGAQLFRDIGFENLGVNKIVSLIHPDNVPSKKVAVRNGMAFEKEALWRRQRTQVFAITRSEWERIK